MNQEEKKRIIKALKAGAIGILPTDTLYGIVGSALNPETVQKIYDLRKRAPQKPMIILISSIEDLELFGIPVDDKSRKILEKLWPNPVSIVLPCNKDSLEYLDRGTNSLAFRMPKNENLLNILKETGPLVAPSANFEGQKPAETIEEAKKYFGDSVDMYVDAGRLQSSPSTIIEFKDGEINILRQGAFQIDPNQLK